LARPVKGGDDIKGIVIVIVFFFFDIKNICFLFSWLLVCYSNEFLCCNSCCFYFCWK
jgi:hypothetical protein